MQKTIVIGNTISQEQIETIASQYKNGHIHFNSVINDSQKNSVTIKHSDPTIFQEIVQKFMKITN